MCETMVCERPRATVSSGAQVELSYGSAPIVW